MDIWQAVVLAITEGITEYLPISSTGHLIVVSALMGMNEDAFFKSFNVIVQFGAIMSVFVLYWRRLKAPLDFYIKIAVGFVPAAILGLLVKDKIDAILGNVQVVGVSLFAGGIFLMFVDRKSFEAKRDISSLSYRDAFLIGLCQCVAFIPGVSRSAASIIGGLFLGLSRREAAEFSFFLAVPTLTGATLIKSLKIFPSLENEQWGLLAVGTFVSFIVGVLAIKGFIEVLNRRGFYAFGVYRIGLGLVIFACIYWNIIS
jgi:undecaprenyl-diphosphatase